MEFLIPFFSANGNALCNTVTITYKEICYYQNEIVPIDENGYPVENWQSLDPRFDFCQITENSQS